MSSFRPPCAALKGFAAPAIYLFLAFLSAPIGAGELVLPDLVVPGRNRTDAVQPYVDLGVEGEWIFRLPEFRRLYRIPVRIDAAALRPEPSPGEDLMPLNALASAEDGAGIRGFSARFAGKDEPIIVLCDRGRSRCAVSVFRPGTDCSLSDRATNTVREFLNG